MPCNQGGLKDGGIFHRNRCLLTSAGAHHLFEANYLVKPWTGCTRPLSEATSLGKVWTGCTRALGNVWKPPISHPNLVCTWSPTFSTVFSEEAKILSQLFFTYRYAILRRTVLLNPRVLATSSVALGFRVCAVLAEKNEALVGEVDCQSGWHGQTA